jgi:hypothetical protein
MRVALAIAILAALGAGAWYLADGRDQSRPTGVSALSPPPRSAPPPASLQPRTTTQPAAPTRTPTTKAPTPPPVVRTPPKATPKPKPQPKPKAAKAPTGFVPARTWAWTPSRGARAYVFRLALNGRTVLQVRTSKPRLVLPRSFRFRAGRYRWTVQRIPRPPNGRLVGDSSFRITAAVAAAANR